MSKKIGTKKAAILPKVKGAKIAQPETSQSGKPQSMDKAITSTAYIIAPSSKQYIKMESRPIIHLSIEPTEQGQYITTAQYCARLPRNTD